MKRILLSILVVLTALQISFAQETEKFRIAIFVPLYLDSAFDEFDEYRYAKNQFPKFINPGLEFYEGAQLALDSLNMEGAQLEVFVYDTRSSTESLETQLERAKKAGVQLMITHSTPQEARTFGDAARDLNIPVVNANLPNDAGISNNPFYVILNPTLRTQCEGIYRYMQKYFSLDNIVVFRKKGPLEDRIKSYFEDYAKQTAGVPLQIKYVDLTDSFSIVQLRRHLDSSQNTLCVAGSLDEAFGTRMLMQLAGLKKIGYPLTILGMPTWDGIREFKKPEFKGVEVVYSTPFYHAKVDPISQSIVNYFNKVMYARPTDMVFRGYEVTWKYAKLLMQYGDDLGSNIGNKQYKVFTDFDVQPVLDREDRTLDYFENKKLYFLRWQDGVMKGVNY
jgi:ABC-type branched-subunit amino acid transport system substrate-binding protein